MVEDYLETRLELQLLIEYAQVLSIAAGGRPCGDDKRYASYIFVKIVSHAVSILRLSPTGAVPQQVGASELWDIGSISVIARALIDGYFSLFYLAIEPATQVEREFRLLLWELDSESNRLLGLQEINSTDPRRKGVEEDVKSLTEKITSHELYCTLSPDQRRQMKKGRLALHLQNSSQCEKAGIDRGYYVVTYRRLSNYVHTYAFAVKDLAGFKAGSEGAMDLLQITLRGCAIFLAKSIEGFRATFDELPMPPEEVDDILTCWIKNVREINTE